MFLHYLKIAWRNLRKYKTQSIISILGLTIGVVFFAYGYHWYQFETTYDSFYPDSDRIYQVYGKMKSTGNQAENGNIPYIAVNKLEQAFPEIETVAVIYPSYGSSFKHGDRDLGYPLFQFVDERFLRMFPPEVIVGAVHENSLKNSDEMIITESFARKYFDTPEKALGETLVLRNNEVYVIQAVIADTPHNTIFQREGYLLDIHARKLIANTDEKTQWKDFHQVQLFIKLRHHADLKKFQEKLSIFAVDNNYNEDLLFELTPLSHVRFAIEYSYERNITYDEKYIRMFIFAGLLLLFAAFFNYLNILLSNIFTRVKEINLRRVTGASTVKIFVQLLIEISLFFVIVALLSLCCIELTSGLFERMFNTVVVSSELHSTLIRIICITAILLYATTFVFIYRFIKKTTFKENIPAKNRFTTGRITLMLQLIISVFAIMSAFVLWHQVLFMNRADWGFDTKNLLQITMKLRDRKPLMDEVGKLSMVEGIINTGFFTIAPNTEKLGPSSVSGVDWDKKPIDLNPQFQSFGIDETFIEEMKLHIIKGRGIVKEDFTRGWKADKAIINETAQRVMEMENPIGQKITVPANWYTAEGRGKEEFEIIGVVKDFHAVGLQSSIPPLIIKGEKYGNEGYFHYIRVTPGTEEEAVKAIKELIPKFRPDDENESLVQTMDQLLSDLGKDEKNQLRLFATLAFLCILIAVFGIYSVSQRETQRRRKEIAIRKTAGAKSKEVMAMFFREYMWVTLAACAVALPAAWFFMQRWLESFAYHIAISWWMFALVIIATGFIVSITIVSQVIRAAAQNPAEVVKSE